MEKKLKVSAKPCNECLFSKNRLVSEEAAERIIQECLETDQYFICHKFSFLQNKTCDSVCCRNFYDRHQKDILTLRLAVLFDFVDFVELPAYT